MEVHLIGEDHHHLIGVVLIGEVLLVVEIVIVGIVIIHIQDQVMVIP
jgi:hypothetical protein